MDATLSAIIIAVIFFIPVALFAVRSFCNRKVKGCINAEIWEQNGDRENYLVKFHDEGDKVKVEVPDEANTKAEYFFIGQDVTNDKYPKIPILGIELLQANVKKVSWFRNDPNPIRRDKKEALITAVSMFNMRDNDFLAFIREAEEEIKRLQSELMKALATKINKNVLYVALLIVGGLGVGSIVIGLQVLDMLQVSLGYK